MRPKARHRSAPSMRPTALRSGRTVKELRSQPGETRVPCESGFLTLGGWGAAAGQAGKGLVGWRDQPSSSVSASQEK